MMGTGDVQTREKNIITPPESDTDVAGDVYKLTQSPTEEENEKREIFMKLTTPRVRYDVEVVTKLIVYTGMYRASIISAMTDRSRYCIYSCCS
jgi:hypothetical protein